MSISVEFPSYPSGKAEGTAARGTAGLRTQLGGSPTTVSALMESGKATGNPSLVKKSIG